MAIADASKVEIELKKIHKAINEIVGHLARLESRIVALEKPQSPK